jgi:hypothetical protein
MGQMNEEYLSTSMQSFSSISSMSTGGVPLGMGKESIQQPQEWKPPKPDKHFHDRVGMFRVANRIIRETPLSVMRLLSTMVVVRAETLFQLDAVEYVAFSMLFDRIPKGEEAPEYRISFMNEDYQVKIDVQRVKDNSGVEQPDLSKPKPKTRFQYAEFDDNLEPDDGSLE